MNSNSCYSKVGTLFSTLAMNEALVVPFSAFEMVKIPKKHSLMHRCNYPVYSALALEQLGAVDARYTKLSPAFLKEIVHPALRCELASLNLKAGRKSTTEIYPSYGDFLKGMNYFLMHTPNLVLTDEDKVIREEIRMFRAAFQKTLFGRVA